MTIAPMMRLALVGAAEDKAAVLEGLQALGCVHLVALRPADPLAPPDAASRRRAASAWRHLRSAPAKRRPWPADRPFDAETAVEAILANKARLREARDRRDFLTRRIADLAPFGDFELPEEPPGGYRLWFYALPIKHRPALERIALPWAVVGREASRLLVAVLAREEPPADLLPVPRTHTGAHSLSTLEGYLEETEIEIERAEAELAELTRHRLALGARLAAAEDADARRAAAGMTLDRPHLFALAGWVPAARAGELEAWALARGLAVALSPPGPADAPPTLLETPERVGGASELTTFYMTPAYGSWDPSLVVFASFAVFFAMILADAGYAALLGLGLLAAWGRLGAQPRLRRLRPVFAAIVATALVYGVLAGSYFGAAPPEGGIAARLAVIDVADIETMMTVSVVIGVLHIALANLAAAWAARSRGAALERIGWAGASLGGLLLWLGPETLGAGLLGIGLTAVFAGAASAGGGGGWLRGIASGALSLASVSRLFGDVLSYMRLFALGLSSASLGATFNAIAADVQAGMPGLGLLLAGLVLIFGHAINLALGVLSGVVHGLRLNVLEFFGWGLSEEGYPFKAFARKEAPEWTN